jgi:hypothetical protein
MVTGEQILGDRRLLKRLSGSYCHKLDETGAIEYQGYVKRVRRDVIVVGLFEWFTGHESMETTVSLLEFERWCFYDNKSEFDAAYRRDRPWLAEIAPALAGQLLRADGNPSP